MKVPCIYDHRTKLISNETYYCCIISNKIITGNEEILPVGKHKFSNSNKDVLAVIFLDCTIAKVPQGLTKVFPNMKTLDIINSKLKNLNKNDMNEYKNLDHFSCDGNKLTYLPGDLFEGFKNLQTVGFTKNMLNIIEPNILDELGNLKFVDFTRNPKYNILFSVYPNHSSNVTLEAIKNHLQDKFYTSEPKAIKFFVSNIQQKFNQEMQKLKLTNQDQQLNFQKLNQEIQKLKKSNEDQQLKFQNFIQNSQTNSLLSDVKKHIQNEDLKDFTIEIDKHKFHVHKLLLSIRSPTIAHMLFKNPDAQNLKIVDFSVETFEVVLKFLYTDELPKENGTNYYHLYVAADKLEIEKLKKFAFDQLTKNINAENALEILELGIKSGHDGLRQKAFDEIKKQYPKIKFKDDCEVDIEKVKKMIAVFKKMKKEMESKISEIME